MISDQRHDRAVAFCCDSAFLHLALFAARQVIFHNPRRSFDIVIAGPEDLALPPWAEALGILSHRLGSLPDHAAPALFTRSIAPLYRILLAGELGGRYSRILYLDSDIFIEGGDFSRLLGMEIGPHPIALALDWAAAMKPGFHAREYIKLGLPPLPYGNTGVQLIDTAAYREQELERRLFDVCLTSPHAIELTDQSLTNIALRGAFAQLAPAWNYQWSRLLPLLDRTSPVFIRHFIGRLKPDKVAGKGIDRRFTQAYRSFAEQLMPEILPLLPDLPPMPPVSLADASKIALRQHQDGRRLAAVFARFADPYAALI